MKATAIKMKRGQVLLFLNGGLKRFAKVGGSANWKYAIFKNTKICESEVEAYPKECIENLENRRLELCQELCEKGADGKPLVTDNKFKISNIEEFNKRYAEIYDSMKAEIDEYNAFLKTEIELDLFVLPDATDIPQGIDNAEDMEAIWPMIP